MALSSAMRSCSGYETVAMAAGKGGLGFQEMVSPRVVFESLVLCAYCVLTVTRAHRFEPESRSTSLGREGKTE